VTHWLANFEAGADTTPSSSNADDAERMRAVERIRNAGADIASAFSSLGAFGTTIPVSKGTKWFTLYLPFDACISNFILYTLCFLIMPSLFLQPSFSASSWTQEIAPQNATYSDIRRRWNGVSPSHLEQMAHAVASTNAVVEASGAATQTNLLEAVRETGKKGSGTSAAAGGRTAQDAIAVEDRPTGNQETSTNLTSLSILQPPSLVASAQAPTRKVDFTNSEAERLGTPPSILQARSGYAEVGQSTAETMRKLLELREKVQSARHEMKGLDASIAKQASAVAALEEEYRLVSADGSDMTRMLEVIDEVKAGKQECERVTAQLQRKLVDLSSTLQTDESELGGLENEIRSLESRRKGIVRSSRDPCWSWPGKLAPGSWIGANPILQTIIGRQQGLSRPRNTTMFARSSIIHGPSDSHFVATRKALLASRLSHAATINTHIGYPVYCLRFDRTGTYFISGADDYLVKVFHLGSGQSSRNKNAQDGSRELRCNYGANLRGAVLVCSLRGHAGVINDIDVSSDNAFLATASVDGDVRVWGLKDGCPVAILRGHKGGANMVSWSKLTPYRLISTGCDGFARMWDIREACLKRYGAQVGKRAEYQLKLSDDEKEGLKNKSDSHNSSNDHSGTPLPVLPVREAPPPSPAGAAATSATTAIEANQIESAVGGVVVPPLPDAVPPLPVALAPNNVPNANPQNEIAPPGQFVANDAIDEGVKLLSKYKHGSTGEDVIGPGTRSRRAAVNVICVARCPLGMYFATGSDDGMCRVFEDDEDHGVATVDARANEEYSFSNTQAPALKTRATRSSDEPVLKLMGHISAITDLAYSNAGDKILSASQKDGVVRIWSLGKATFERSGESGVSQIVVNLTDPKSRAPSQPSRRTQGGAASISKVSCDVAVWTHDDTKIITSQSVLVKQSDSEIQPGSQYLFLWDSRTGQCLLGISGAHTMQCPVVVPHPTDSSLVFSAGADGIAKMWDWESGRCIFSHSNKVEYGPMEPSERNKLAGYLDGSFNPDGTMVVLTDDSGRLTIFDSNTVIASNGNAWMREQYFANDYYDLSYDNSGYCIEKGSERPPHLSPKGVRCDHTGSPWSDKISEAFSKLVGPSPLPEQISRWRRAEIRRKAASALESNNTVSERQALKVRRGIREFDPLSTIVIKGPGHLEETEIHSSKEHRTSNGPIHAGRRGTVDSLPTNSSPRNVSGNYRYLDYDDMMRREGNQDEDEPDSDDEEFSPAAPGRNRGAMENSDDDSDNDMDLDDDETEFVSRGNQRNRSRPVERRERAQRRANRHRDDQFVEIDSDDENVEQIMSTNNSPSGPFVEDYESHFWRMPTGNVRSKWLRRMESDTAYEGRKMYTPQLGDSVVYIARAHYETINLYPSLQPPWQSWPQGTAWPVVRCCVRGVRFRFPYEDYYRSSQ
jgi:WD40 repeat protein